MEVYKIKPDVNQFQSFLPVDDAIWKTDVLKFDGNSKLQTWQPPPVYVLYPKKALGNFFRISAGAFAFDSAADEMIRGVCEMAGELLPLPYKGETYFVLNVLECIDCLDGDSSKWTLTAGGDRIGVAKYMFYKNRFSESSIFKIPETARGELLTVSGRDEDVEFKSIVERAGLKGILFEKVWQS